MPQHVPLLQEMMNYERGCPERIHHFLKVHGFARLIAGLEQLDEEAFFILEAAAIVHDIGIRPSLEKYCSESGKHQEVEGPPVAEAMLRRLGYAENIIERVCYLVARHHTYDGIEGNDHQILVEADFLVNIHENGLSEGSAMKIKNEIFRTSAGKTLLQTMFGS